MKIEKRKINDLKFYPGNPRKISKEMLESLKKSLSEFGIVDPLVINKDNQVIGGNQRLKALQDLKIEEVDAVIVDFPKSKEKALNVALNKIAGEFDGELLESFIKGIEPIDLELTGFDNNEIEDLIAQFRIPEEGLTDDDEIPEKVETVCKTGDLWQLGNHRLLCGDATKKEDVDKLMGGEKADMVFTDPPYGINYKDLKGKHRPIANDNGVAISDLLTLLPNDCPRYVCCNWKSYPEFYQAIPNSKALIVWDKGYGVQNLDKFYKRHEFIIYYGKFGGEKTVDGDVWLINREVRLDHPTAKPVELIERAIRYSSKVDNIVLDFFGGSGSTLIACEKLGRRCYMMEIDEHYCDVIIQRWQNFTGKQAEKIDG